jgi:hypothetical protein
MPKPPTPTPHTQQERSVPTGTKQTKNGTG